MDLEYSLGPLETSHDISMISYEILLNRKHRLEHFDSNFIKKSYDFFISHGVNPVDIDIVQTQTKKGFRRITVEELAECAAENNKLQYTNYAKRRIVFE